MESDLEKLLKICASRSRNKELKNKPTTGGIVPSKTLIIETRIDLNTGIMLVSLVHYLINC